jgi:adenylosuccinate synthase
MLKEAIMLNGINELALTKMDVLDGLPRIGVAVAYRYKNKTFKQFPSDFEAVSKVTPVFKYLKGWRDPICGARSYDDLPAAARDYVRYIEDQSGVKASIISVGSGREDTIIR